MYKDKYSFKRIMAKHFSAAATSYDQSATIQHIIAAKLHKMVANNALNSSVTIVDLGSGTGRETALLANNYQQSTVVGIDIATQMIQTASQKITTKNINWCQADIDNLPFKKNTFNLAFSNLALQWCDLTTALQQVYYILKSQGYFIFSILYEGSLNELKASWDFIKEPNRVNSYLSANAITKLLSSSLFHQKELSFNKYTLYYPDVMTLLRSLKKQGVNTLYKTKGTLTPRSSINKLIDQYETFRTNQGIPLSYMVASVILQKL